MLIKYSLLSAWKELFTVIILPREVIPPSAAKWWGTKSSRLCKNVLKRSAEPSAAKVKSGGDLSKFQRFSVKFFFVFPTGGIRSFLVVTSVYFYHHNKGCNVVFLVQVIVCKQCSRALLSGSVIVRIMCKCPVFPAFGRCLPAISSDSSL